MRHRVLFVPRVWFVVGSCAAALAGRAAGSPTTPLSTSAEMRALPGTAYNYARPVSLNGVVTLADAERNLLVIQDDTGAVALHPDPPNTSVQPGQRVSLKAEACFPYADSFPAYPYHPTGRDVQSTFEAPDNEGNFRLNRMRGWVRPPATGYYTFWIASDDSSDLWLSTSADPAEVRRIAFVPTGQWTGRRDWGRFRSQRSEPVLLQAAQSYYVEALQEQQLADSHLAVAWEGPNLSQAIVAEEFLTPWRPDAERSASDLHADANRGILREYWTNYAVADVTGLTRINPGESSFTVQGVKLDAAGDEAWPQARPLDAGQPLMPEDRYRWVKGEGEVRFVASDGASARAELAVGANRLLIRIERWQGTLPTLRPHLRARFNGVCEGQFDANGRLTAGFVSVPSAKEISFFEEASNGTQDTSASATPSAPTERELGGYYFARGVVTFDGRVLNRQRLFVQDGLAGISISQEDHPLFPPLRLGHFVEIGGRLLPGKYTPSILPLGVNILGWQDLPVPTILSPDAPAASYRDGQWSQIDGVVRSVNADGTMVTMRKQMPLLVWVGQSDPHELEGFVDATVRVRGVMSLDTFDSPVLLSPSRNFVATLEPAPSIPQRPVSIVSLYGVDFQPDRAHRIKAVGTVTYCHDRDLFLQEGTAALRVQLNHAASIQIGSTIEAVGFPNREGAMVHLTESSWNPVGTPAPIAPENWDLQSSDRVRDGTLVKVEGRLLSQRTSGSELVVQLQTSQRTCEAVLEAPSTSGPNFVPGSMVAVTGICEESASALVPIRNASENRLASLPTRILLRDASDIVFLQGPPWWTLPRTVFLISVLLALVAGSLLRLRLQNRRFSQKQAVRMAFTREILEKQEGERRRIAASLHDSLGQDLLVIRNQTRLAIQAANDPASLRQRLTDISDTTLQALAEVREITHNLRPYQLDRLGLTQAIRAVIRKMTENGSMALACHLDDVDALFDKEAEIHIYRIVQEGMNNIVKHSEATEATVVVKHTFGVLSISIRDNGRGLTAAADPSDTGFGLSGIRERVEILGGTIRIDSAPQDGANLQIEVPVPVPSNAE